MLRLPPGVDDVDSDLHGAEHALADALTALRAAQHALGLCDWLALSERIAAARDELHVAALTLTALAPATQAWADHVTDY